MMKIFLTLLFVVFSKSVFAQQYYFDEGSRNTAVNKLVEVSGPVTKKEYDSFWEILSITDKNRDSAAIARIKNEALLKYQYEKEVWVCVEKAWSSKKYSPCRNANNSLGLLRAAKMRANDLAGIKSTESETKALLESAAAHGKIKDSAGSDVDLTLDVIKVKKAEIDNAIARLNRVLQMRY